MALEIFDRLCVSLSQRKVFFWIYVLINAVVIQLTANEKSAVESIVIRTDAGFEVLYADVFIV